MPNPQTASKIDFANISIRYQFIKAFLNRMRSKETGSKYKSAQEDFNLSNHFQSIVKYAIKELMAQDWKHLEINDLDKEILIKQLTNNFLPTNPAAMNDCSSYLYRLNECWFRYQQSLSNQTEEGTKGDLAETGIAATIIALLTGSLYFLDPVKGLGMGTLLALAASGIALFIETIGLMGDYLRDEIGAPELAVHLSLAVLAAGAAFLLGKFVLLPLAAAVGVYFSLVGVGILCATLISAFSALSLMISRSAVPYLLNKTSKEYYALPGNRDRYLLTKDEKTKIAEAREFNPSYVENALLAIAAEENDLSFLEKYDSLSDILNHDVENIRRTGKLANREIKGASAQENSRHMMFFAPCHNDYINNMRSEDAKQGNSMTHGLN